MGVVVVVAVGVAVGVVVVEEEEHSRPLYKPARMNWDNPPPQGFALLFDTRSEENNNRIYVRICCRSCLRSIHDKVGDHF